MAKYSNKMLCFSPPVMLATFAIETVLAIYTFLRYKSTTVVRIASLMLALLAVFQLAEYSTCGKIGLEASFWSRMGYIAITLLPPLGVHLVQAIAERKHRWLTLLSYASGFGFAAVFGFSATAFSGYVCTSNYAIFQLSGHLGGIYAGYYYTCLFIAIGLALFYSIKSAQKIREALILLTFGYLVFLLPTGMVNLINPQTMDGIPSIMCGFAVLFAIILAAGIVPITASNKS